jgi:hypothetical protein
MAERETKRDSTSCDFTLKAGPQAGLRRARFAELHLVLNETAEENGPGVDA